MLPMGRNVLYVIMFPVDATVLQPIAVMYTGEDVDWPKENAKFPEEYMVAFMQVKSPEVAHLLVV